MAFPRFVEVWNEMKEHKDPSRFHLELKKNPNSQLPGVEKKGNIKIYKKGNVRTI